MALTASDYIVLNGLGIANSWAQNRMARLSLEQRDKAQEQDELFRRDEMKRRDEEARLDRENRMAVADKTIEREDTRQSWMMDRFDKNQARQVAADQERSVREQQKIIAESDAAIALEKQRGVSKRSVKALENSQKNAEAVGNKVAEWLGIPTKNSIDLDNQKRLVKDKRSSDAIQGYKAMDLEEKEKWQLVPDEYGFFSLKPRKASEPTPASEVKPIEKQLPSGLKFKYWPSSGFMPPTK